MTTGDPTAARRRGRPRRAEASTTILRAALELLAERGFRAATMDAIAERAGVGKNTIYRRWCSKDELILDALSDLTSELELRQGEDAADVYDLLLDHVDAAERLFGGSLASKLLPGLLGELQRNEAFADAYAERVVKPLRGPIVALLTEARERGELRPDADAELIADLLVGAGFLRMVFPFGRESAAQPDPKAVLDTIWRGVALG